MARRLAPTLLLLALSLALLVMRAEGGAPYTVSANYPVKVLVNGEERSLPTRVAPGDLVCAPEASYLDEGVRIVFGGWEGLGRDPCVRAYGNLTAAYTREYLVHVYSEPPALRRSMWVSEGTVLTLDYPETYVESEGVRWVFQHWSGGEKPFQPSNRIYVARPARLEAHYVREFRVAALATHGVRVNGSGWYREGAIAVVAAPREVYVDEGTRLVLAEWVTAGSVPAIVMPQTSPGVAVLEVRGPHVVMARYRFEHLVTATGPQGVIFSGWVGEGEELKLTTPEYIELGQGARLRFEGWSGAEGAGSRELSIRVTAPLRIEAIYVRQYLLSVTSPVGAGGAGWYDEGSTAMVTVPENPSTNVFVKRRLNGFSGDCGECRHNGGRMALVMDRPRSVAAVYVYEPDLLNLGILAGTVAAGVALYITGRRRGGGAPAEEPQPTCPACGAAVTGDSLFCHRCGSVLRAHAKSTA
jgi:hypothetical protein